MKPHATKLPALTAIAVAVLTACGVAQAAEVDEVTRASKPESTVMVGVGSVSRDNQRFGQYSGLVDSGVYGLFDVTLANRDDTTGTTFIFTGRNLGLSTRDIRLEHSRQGDWGYFVEFNQIPRYSQYVVNTGLSGIGTGNLTINGDTLRDVQLMTERKILTVGLDKTLPSNLDVQVRVRHEQKTGSRIFGRGTTGASGFEFLAEPIDSANPQLEATLGYTGERLQLSGGYYGSWYNNHNPGLNVSGGTVGISPIGLPPDNESHQLHLAGGYSFSPTTRGTFKLSHARALQNDSFIVAALPGNSSLDGRIDVTQLQLGLSARPTPKLSLLANLRYEDRDDKTPVRLYSSLAGATSTFNGFYEPRSITRTDSKMEAGYRLPNGFHLTGGVDLNITERAVPYWLGGALASVSTREKTEETTLRLKLRRSLSETINGSIAYAHSNRDGSDYLTTVLNNGTTGSNLLSPLHLADRERDLLRLAVDWTPTEPLSLQFTVDASKDQYSYGGRSFGPSSGRARLYSADASYAFSDKWRGTVWLSRNETEAAQLTQEATTPWTADLRDRGDAVGIGVRGKPTRKLEFGADLQRTRDRGEYRIEGTPPVVGTTLPPDTHYRVTRLKLSGKYALRKDATVGVNYFYEYWNIDDWTWSTWTYTDGTRLTQEPRQTTHFIGAYVQLRWW